MFSMNRNKHKKISFVYKKKQTKGLCVVRYAWTYYKHKRKDETRIQEEPGNCSVIVFAIIIIIFFIIIFFFGGGGLSPIFCIMIFIFKISLFFYNLIVFKIIDKQKGASLLIL